MLLRAGGSAVGGSLEAHPATGAASGHSRELLRVGRPFTQIISHVREEFAVEVQLRDFFESPTVAALAANIEQERETPQYQVPPRIEVLPRGDRSLDDLWRSWTNCRTRMPSQSSPLNCGPGQ